MYVDHVHRGKNLEREIQKKPSQSRQSNKTTARSKKRKSRVASPSSSSDQIQNDWSDDTSKNYSATQRYYSSQQANQKSKTERYSNQLPKQQKDNLQRNRQNFGAFAEQFYPQRNSPQYQLQQFEPRYIKTNRDEGRRKPPKLSSDEDDEGKRQQWRAKATKEGFLYFFIKGTTTFQWNFPKYYDPRTKKSKPYFVDKWAKRYDDRGKKFWQNSESKHIQMVRPDSETYFMQASILGNLAFLEVYIRCKGSLLITDQQSRTGLHHAAANGHREFLTLLCNFEEKLIEAKDVNGATPLFLAIRYNEVECLKILISYDCNIFHRMRNGDTCLHIAAAYNSLDSMVIISNYGGFELLLVRNREGLRPIEVAEKMRNYECYDALQKLERNLVYKNALLERDIKQLDSLAKKKKYRKNQVVPFNEPVSSQRSSARSSGKATIQSRLQLPINKLKVIQEQSSEDYSEGDEDLNRLGGKKKYKQRVQEYEKEFRAQEHQKMYMSKIKSGRSRKQKGPKTRDDLPLFKDFDPRTAAQENQRKTSGKEGSRKNSRSKIFAEEEFKDEGRMQDQDEDEEESYYYEESQQTHKSKLSRRSDPAMFDMSKDHSLQKSRHDISNRQPKELDRTQNYFHLSIRDDNSVIHKQNQKLNQLKSARDKFLRDRKHYADRSFDPENQLPIDEEPPEEPPQPKSLIEKAYSRTSSLVLSIGGFFNKGIEKIKDFVFNDDSKRILGRSKSNEDRKRARSARSGRQGDDADDSNDQYKTPRGRSEGTRQKAKSQRYKVSQVVPMGPLSRALSSSSNEEELYRYKPNGKKSRRVQPIQEEQQPKTQRADFQAEGSQQNQSSLIKQDKSSSQNKSSSSGNNISHKKSISIQAEPPLIQIAKNLPTQPITQPKAQQVIVKNQSTASLKSIGVGSLNINESMNTPSQYSAQSQKLQHSRMIQREKKKRLGNKSKLLLNKNYQSSDDERKHQKPQSVVSDVQQPKHLQQTNFTLNERSPSPAPRFMKEEVAFFKQEQMYQMQIQAQQNQVNVLEIPRDPVAMMGAFSQSQVETMSVAHTQQSPQQQQLFTPSQRQLIKKSSVQTGHVPNNQRYRNNSTSLSGNELPSARKPDNEDPLRVNSLQRQITDNVTTGMRAPSLLTQEQFDMIMLNSEDENAKKNHNNLYQVQEADKLQRKPKGNEDIKKFYDELMKNQSLTQIEELKKEDQTYSFDDTNLSNLYSKIMHNHLSNKVGQQQHTSGSGLNDLKLQKDGGSQQALKNTRQSQSKEAVNDHLNQSLFNPPADNPPDVSIVQFNDFDNQGSFNELASFLKDFDRLREDSKGEDSNIQQHQPSQVSIQYQSNLLDRGQFVQNSCMSISGVGNQNNQQNQSTTIQRALVTGLQSNSMHNLMYQSDAESDYAKRGKKMLQVLESPARRKGQLIPPQLTLKSVTQLPQAAAQLPLDSQRQEPSVEINTEQQKQMIDLFKDDEEQEKLQQNKQTNMVKSPLRRSRPEPRSLADELKLTFNDADSDHLVVPQKTSDQEFINLVNTESDDQHQVAVARKNSRQSKQSQESRQSQEEQVLDQKLKDKIFQKLEQLQMIQSSEGQAEEKRTVSQFDQKKNEILTFNDDEDDDDDFQLNQIVETKQVKAAKQSKKNNRYEIEDSLIQFDLSQSKIDQTERHITVNHQPQMFDQTNNIQEESSEFQEEVIIKPKDEQRRSLKEKIQEQRQSYSSQQSDKPTIHTSNQIIQPNAPLIQEIAQQVQKIVLQPKAKLEVEVLPLKVLRAAYKLTELQTWEGENHSLLDQKSIQKGLLGNMMIQAFSNSSEKPLIKRNFIPYQGATAQTQILLSDTAATATANLDEQKQRRREESPVQIGQRALQPVISYPVQQSLTSIRSGHSQETIMQELDSISRIYDDLETVQEEEFGEKTNTLEESKIIQAPVRQSLLKSPKKIPKQQSTRYSTQASMEKSAGLTAPTNQDQVQQLFYKQQEPNQIKATESDADDQANILKWRQQDKQNRSTAAALIYNIYTSSEDENKRRSNLFANAIPKRRNNALLQSTSGAPLHNAHPQQINPNAATKRSTKDVSFKSQNVSTHTESSERLKDNLRNFQRNKLFGAKKKEQQPNQ